MKEKMRPTAVDVAIIHQEKILLVKRENAPYKGKWVLPGGFVEIDETVEKAAVREAKEETGLDVEILSILGVYSDPKRDERHTVSIAFIAYPKNEIKVKAQKGEIKEAKWFDLKSIPELGFDHNQIVKDAIEFISSIQCKECIHCIRCDY